MRYKLEHQIKAIDPENAIIQLYFNQTRNKLSSKGNTKAQMTQKALGVETSTIIYDSNIWKGLFLNKTPPKEGDWLWEHPEEKYGQTFKQFIRRTRRYCNKYQHKIGLIQIGDIDFKINDATLSFNQCLIECIQNFFGLEVKLLEPISTKSLTKRFNLFSGVLQLNATEILDELDNLLVKNRDLFCVMGYTIYDLYPSDDYNFVFGLARPNGGVGVFSFARYLPGFENINTNSNLIKLLNGLTDDTRDILSNNEETLFIRRSLKVLTHEIGHIFGILHCAHFECVMNGGNHLEEHDCHTFYLCPLCLSKLFYARIKNSKYFLNKHEKTKIKNADNDLNNFDLMKRYELILRFCEKYLLKTEAEWYSKRIKSIRDATKSIAKKTTCLKK